MRRSAIRLVVACACLSLAACSSMHTVLDRSNAVADPAGTLQTSLKPWDYVVLTLKNDSKVAIVVSAVNGTEIVGAREGSDVQESFKIEDLQVVERHQKSATKTGLLVAVSAVGAAMAFMAVVLIIGFNP